MRLVDTLLSRPSVYRTWQRPFADAKLAPFLRRNSSLAGARVLDVGCGPGTNTHHFPNTEYVGVDINPLYIEAARKQHDAARFEVVDVVGDPIPGPDEFDLIIVNSLFHHIDTPGVESTLQKLSERLAGTGSVHILDLVRPERPGLAQLLARWDRGEFVRPLEDWKALFEAAFDPDSFEPYPLPARGPSLWHMVYFEGHKRP